MLSNERLSITQKNSRNLLLEVSQFSYIIKSSHLPGYSEKIAVRNISGNSWKKFVAMSIFNESMASSPWITTFYISGLRITRFKSNKFLRIKLRFVHSNNLFRWYALKLSEGIQALQRRVVNPLMHNIPKWSNTL